MYDHGRPKRWSVLVPVGVIAFLVVQNLRTSVDLAFPKDLIANAPPPKAQLSHNDFASIVHHQHQHRRPRRQQGNATTLVILTGDLRCGERAWSSLERNVLEVNNADLALMVTAKILPRYQNASLFRLAKYNWPLTEYDDWSDAVDIMFRNHNSSKSWRQELFASASPESILLGGIRYKNATGHENRYSGSVAIQMMTRYFLQQKIQQLRLTEVYDKFVITRADHYYLCPHNITNLQGPHLWLPYGQDFHGYTDRHLVVGRHQVLQSLDIYPRFLVKEPEKYRHMYSDPIRAPHTNPETLLKTMWMDMNLTVQRFPRTMFICAVDGDPRSTLGRKWFPLLLKEEKVHFKYKGEYRDSRTSCGRHGGESGAWYVPKPPKKKKPPKWRRVLARLAKFVGLGSSS